MSCEHPNPISRETYGGNELVEVCVDCGAHRVYYDRDADTCPWTLPTAVAAAEARADVADATNDRLLKQTEELRSALTAMHRRAQAAEANPRPVGDQHEGCRHEMRRYWERRRRWALRLIAMSKGLGARMVAAGVPDWFLDINGKRCEHGKRDPVVLLERLITQRDEARVRAAKLAEALRAIQQWDRLNPPAREMCSDFPWLKRLVDDALATHGVWCIEDCAWCCKGSEQAMRAELPRWQSGEAAAVDPARFHYEVRETTR